MLALQGKGDYGFFKPAHFLNFQMFSINKYQHTYLILLFSLKQLQ